jgi:DNA-binding transcriptional MerR regulator
MIQNYIRHGLVPPPKDKRLYTHKHLAALFLIGYLKTAFDMDTIKEKICPLMDENGLPLDVYGEIIKKWAEISAQWKKHVAKTINDSSVDRLALMAHAAELTGNAAPARTDSQN